MGAWRAYALLCLSGALLLSTAAQPVDILETTEEALAALQGNKAPNALKPVPFKSEGMRQRIKLFIGIPSLHEHGDLRDAARETWIPMAKATHAVAVRFFCYVNTTDEGLMQWMKDEQNQHRDTVIVTPESLGGRAVLKEQAWQTMMTINLFKTATEKFEPDFVMRAADDAYMNTPVIMRLLKQQRGAGHIWYGNATPGFILDPREHGNVPEYKELWEDSIDLPVIPQYMHGAGAIMSAKVAEAVLAAHKIVGLRMLQNDNAAIGLWLSAFQMRYLNETEAGCSVRPFQPALIGAEEGKEEVQWDAAEAGAFCLSHEMPLAVVHPCTPEVMRKVLRSAAACRDTLSHSRTMKESE